MKKKAIWIVALLVIVVLVALIFHNVFGSSNSSRIKSTDNYKLTNNEKNAAKDKLSEIENVESIKIYTNVKIIKIIVNLSEDTDFETVQNISNEALSCFSEENLQYFDVEIYVNTKNESEIYPQIGYKHKSKDHFKW